jgi:quinolinate synthase
MEPHTTATEAEESAREMAAVRRAKAALGSRLIVLGHHYQRDEIIELSDFVGDSFGLSRQAAAARAERIVFCGVHFMAESAAILSPAAAVYLPDPLAGCPMAEMAPLDQVEAALERISDWLPGAPPLPVTYMNSSAALKALCGERGGLVCTSSNAEAAFRWAFDRAKRLIFFPDENLGRNTADRLDLPAAEICLFDPAQPDGGLNKAAVERSRLILWKGHCHIHTWFTVAQVEAARHRHPDCAVVVHPECIPAVVAAADDDGSTEYICRFVEQAEAGSAIGIATEIHLVKRLAARHPDKTVFEISRSLCPNMFRTSPRKLLEAIEHPNPDQRVSVPEAVAAKARLALERMLALGNDRAAQD